MSEASRKNGVERKYSTSNEQFWDTFPDKIISLTCFKFPDISRFSRQVLALFATACFGWGVRLQISLPLGRGGGMTPSNTMCRSAAQM